MSLIQTNAIVPISAATTLTAVDSGKIFYLTSALADYVITLPAPTIPGLVYKFVVVVTNATNQISLTSTDANINAFIQLNNAVTSPDWELA